MTTALPTSPRGRAWQVGRGCLKRRAPRRSRGEQRENSRGARRSSWIALAKYRKGRETRAGPRRRRRGSAGTTRRRRRSAPLDEDDGEDEARLRGDEALRRLEAPPDVRLHAKPGLLHLPRELRRQVVHEVVEAVAPAGEGAGNDERGEAERPRGTRASGRNRRASNRSFRDDEPGGVFRATSAGGNPRRGTRRRERRTRGGRLDACRPRLSAASSPEGAPRGGSTADAPARRTTTTPTRGPVRARRGETPPRGGAPRDATSARGGGAPRPPRRGDHRPEPAGSPPTIGPVRPTTLRPRGVPFGGSSDQWLSSIV